MNSYVKCPSFKKLLLPFCILSCSIALYIPANAQEQPPKPIQVKVSTAQHLNFGTIVPIPNVAGSVEVEYTSIPKATNVLLLHPNDCSAAIFIVESEPGILITIDTPNLIVLGNSGYTLNMILGTPNIDLKESGKQFITQRKFDSKETYIYIGGTLEIPAAQSIPPGLYNCFYTVIFNQQ